MTKLAVTVFLLAAPAYLLVARAFAQRHPRRTNRSANQRDARRRAIWFIQWDAATFPGLPAGAKPAGYNPMPTAKEATAPTAPPSPPASK